MENFKLFKIEDSLKNSLQKMNFTKPTPIQGMAIPAALEGKDILGTAPVSYTHLTLPTISCV